MADTCTTNQALNASFTLGDCSPVDGLGSWRFEVQSTNLIGVSYEDLQCSVPAPLPGFLWTGYAAPLGTCVGPRYFKWSVQNDSLVTVGYAEQDCVEESSRETIPIGTCEHCLACSTLTNVYVWVERDGDNTVQTRFFEDPNCTAMVGELNNAPTDVCSATTREVSCSVFGGCVYIPGDCFQEVCPNLVQLNKEYGSELLADCIAEDPSQAVNAKEINGLALSLSSNPVDLSTDDGVLEGLNRLEDVIKSGDFSNPALFFCQADDFVQVVNCLNPETSAVNSPWYSYCVDLTEEEKQLGGVGTVASRTLFGNFSLYRVAFDQENVVLTETKGLWRLAPYLCTSRPWYIVERCVDPLGTTCLYEFAGVSTFGLTQFTGYGSYSSNDTCGVVATDVAPELVNYCISLKFNDNSGDSNLVLILAIVIPIVVIAALVAFYVLRKYRANEQVAIARFKRKHAPGTITSASVLRLLGLQENEKPDISLVSTDVKGSTRLWEQDPTMVNRATHVHDTAMRQMISRHYGYEVRTEGDSFLVAFHTAEDALGFCLSLQLLLLTCDWPLELESSQDACSVYFQESLVHRGMRVRMAVATGQAGSISTNALTKRVEYSGPLVDTLKLLEGFSDGGQIVMDTFTYQQILGTSDGTYHQRGLKKEEGLCGAASGCLPSNCRPTKSKILSHGTMDEELSPVFMDLGVYTLNEGIKDSDAEEGMSDFQIGAGLEVMQVLPRKILARALYFEKPEKFKNVKPGFFDAPMAHEGFLCALERLKTGAEPSPDASAFSISEEENTLGEKAFTMCLVFSTMKITEFSIFGSVEAEQYAFLLYKNLVRETLPLFHGYECQLVDNVFMLAFFNLESAVNWCLQLQKAIELANHESEAHFKKHESSKPLERRSSWNNSHGIPTRQKFVMTCREGLYFDSQFGLYRGTPSEVFPHGSSGRADYFGRLVNRAARFQNSAYPGSAFLPKKLADEYFSSKTELKEGKSGYSLESVQVHLYDPGSFQFKGLSKPMDVASLIVYDKQKLLDVAMRPGGKGSQVRKEGGLLKTYRDKMLYSSAQIVAKALQAIAAEEEASRLDSHAELEDMRGDLSAKVKHTSALG